MVASYVYEGFGKVIRQTGGSVPYCFCGLWGYRDDGDAGLLHVGARYYEVEIGRWVQKDPLMMALNSYTYVEGDPINITDSTGLTKVFDLGKGYKVIVDQYHPTHGPHVDVISREELLARIGKGWKVIWGEAPPNGSLKR